MTKHEIVHIIKVIFRQIKKTIPSIVKHFDQDSIHKFRVQIKKLRAFLRLLSYEMEEPKDLKLPKSLKKIYTVTGAVRSLQLQLLQTNNPSKNDNDLTQYNQQLSNDLNSRIVELKTLIDEKIILGKEKKNISKIPENIDDSVIAKFYQLKINSINSIIEKKKFSDEEIHSIRKLIKDMIYVSKILHEPGFQLAQNNAFKEEDQSIAEKIAQELGEYNDISSGLRFLMPEGFNKINPDEKQKLESIRSAWNLRKKKLKADLINSITAWPVFRKNG